MEPATVRPSRPILFSADMVLAVLGKRKTVTRRVIAPLPGVGLGPEQHSPFLGADGRWRWMTGKVSYKTHEFTHRFGAPGDGLWVQEAHQFVTAHGRDVDVRYLADSTERHVMLTEAEAAKLYARRSLPTKPQPGRFMFRSCSRVESTVVDVRPEQLGAMTEDEAIREGIVKGDWESHDEDGKPSDRDFTHLDAFRWLFERIHGRGSWDPTLWVWRVEFK